MAYYGPEVALLPIITGADAPILRTKTKSVTRITKELVKLLKDMDETRIGSEGAGIAAPQVGRSERVCIAMINKVPVALINPEITWKSEETDVQQEGCLSLPGQWIDVPRAIEIIISFKNTKGAEQEMKLRGWSARVVQHEVDHLDGKLIVDYAA